MATCAGNMRMITTMMMRSVTHRPVVAQEDQPVVSKKKNALAQAAIQSKPKIAHFNARILISHTEHLQRCMLSPVEPTGP
jgi:hypothetical protein